MKITAQNSNNLNGVNSRIVFCLWTGSELMSQNRLQALWSIFKNTGRPVALVTQNTLGEWVLPHAPLHPAYKYLSSTHKSDYLRCYLMHHYGGGYSDIKYTEAHWESYFVQLEQSQESLALGYTELVDGMPHLTGPQGDMIRKAHQEIIGLCAFIFKPNTDLTSTWYRRLHELLDQKLELLEAHPGKFALDQKGLILPDGQASLYPLRWAEILGEILHPLFYENRNKLIKAPIAPKFHSYR